MFLSLLVTGGSSPNALRNHLALVGGIDPSSAIIGLDSLVYYRRTIYQSLEETLHSTTVAMELRENKFLDRPCSIIT